jgi:hypothetical protein
MKLIFVHGWSTTNTDTYGSLPRILADKAAQRGLSLDIVDIHLARYISFHNEVRMDDVTRALNQALLDAAGDGSGGIGPFSCVTHSTGGPVMRCWVDRYYGAARLAKCPLAHLVMLAPANHGSPLAALGSERIGRLKSWFQGIEPGTGILRWLELGSTGSRELNLAWLDGRPVVGSGGFRPFVLTGETIDAKLYDHLNSYTGEAGSDGVVRVAGANLDYSWLTLSQGSRRVSMTGGGGGEALAFKYEGRLRSSAPVPFLIVEGASHAGDKLGIMRSPTPANANGKPVVKAILDALSVGTAADYEALRSRWAEESNAVQAKERGKGGGKRCFQIVFQVSDDQGRAVTDYDVLLLAGADYDPDRLPKGFFIDKQLNKHSRERITFFFDYDVMMKVPDGQFGFRVTARPDKGFVCYAPAEFRSSAKTLDEFVDPNTTLYVDLVLRRLVDEETARLDPAKNGPQDFKKRKPSGQFVP